MIENPERIASKLRNFSARPDPGRTGPVQKIRPIQAGPVQNKFGPSRPGPYPARPG